MRLRLAALAAVIAAAVAMAAPAAQAWTPEGATYGVGSQTNIPVTMSDGTVLRANVYYPTDPSTGQEAAGSFPVLLSQTPYGKDQSSAGGSSQLSELSGESTYLVQRGYIDVVADVRGTGGSTGEWGLFDPVQGTDGATLVNWAAKLAHSDGDIGLLGASYLGINQFETAADAGSAHVKAMFPTIAGNDLYRDTAFAGGFPDIEFSSFYLALTGSLNLLLPPTEANDNFATALTDHVHDLADFDASLLTGAETGGDAAYDLSRASTPGSPTPPRRYTSRTWPPAPTPTSRATRWTRRPPPPTTSSRAVAWRPPRRRTPAGPTRSSSPPPRSRAPARPSSGS